jgi:hypothetical protein
VILPLVLSGIEGGHAIANLLFGSPTREVFAEPSSGRELLPVVTAAVLATLLVGLAGRVAGVWWSSHRQPLLARAFLLLPPAGFVLLELGEALASPAGGGWHSVLGGTFAAGLALQLPVGLLGFALARWALSSSDELADRVAWGGPRTLASRPVCPCASRPDQADTGRSLIECLRGRAPPAPAAAAAGVA